MTLPNYATIEELNEKVTVPSWIDAEDLLDMATDKIRESSKRLRYVYRLDSDGLPLDPGTRASLARASVLQAAFWVSERYNPVRDRIEPEEGATEGPIVTSESQDGLSQHFLVSEKTVALELARVRGLAPQAARELRTNLRHGRLAVFG